jgi:phosphoenolpyruvate-protein kinase (PTS system EI component)
VAPGLALGPVHVVRAAPDVIPTWTIPEDEVEREIVRLLAAIDETSDELKRRQKLVAQHTGDKDAEIFAVHRMLLSTRPP